VISLDQQRAKIKELEKARLDAMAAYREIQSPSAHAAEKTFRRFLVTVDDTLNNLTISSDDAKKTVRSLLDSLKLVDPKTITAQQIRLLTEQVDSLIRIAPKIQNRDDAYELKLAFIKIKSEIGKTYAVNSAAQKDVRKQNATQEKISNLSQRANALNSVSSTQAAAAGLVGGALTGSSMLGNPTTSLVGALTGGNRAAMGIASLGSRAVGGLVGGVLGGVAAPIARKLSLGMATSQLSRLQNNSSSALIGAKNRQLQIEGELLDANKSYQSTVRQNYPPQAAGGASSSVGAAGGSNYTSNNQVLKSIDQNISKLSTLMLATMREIKSEGGGRFNQTNKKDAFNESMQNDWEESVLETLRTISSKLGHKEIEKEPKEEKKEGGVLAALLGTVGKYLLGGAFVAAITAAVIAGVKSLLPTIQDVKDTAVNTADKAANWVAEHPAAVTGIPVVGPVVAAGAQVYKGIKSLRNKHATKGAIDPQTKLLMPTGATKNMMDRASKLSGVSKAITYATGAYESQMDPSEISPTGASGIFQITDDYIIDAMEQARKEKDYKAADILQAAYKDRSKRTNLDVQEYAFGYYNRRHGALQSVDEHYARHNLGPRGAKAMFAAPRGMLAKDVKGLDSRSAPGNPDVFLEKGKDRTVQQVLDHISKRVGKQANKYEEHFNKTRVVQGASPTVNVPPPTVIQAPAPNVSIDMGFDPMKSFQQRNTGPLHN